MDQDQEDCTKGAERTVDRAYKIVDRLNNCRQLTGPWICLEARKGLEGPWMEEIVSVDGWIRKELKQLWTELTGPWMNLEAWKELERPCMDGPVTGLNKWDRRNCKRR